MTSYRGKKLTRKTEDYLEAILVISLSKGYAKTRDVATLLGVTPSSTVEMFIKLDKMGLIEYRKYEGVRLKPDGLEIARTIKFRHDTLYSFLRLIGINEETADRDACRMEHELDPGTIREINRFVSYLEEEDNSEILLGFERYREKQDQESNSA